MAVAVGALDEVLAAAGDTDHAVDETFAGHVALPGLIDQHLHPILGASTLATEVIATEDWALPDRTFPAAQSDHEYVAASRAAHERTRATPPTATGSSPGDTVVAHFANATEEQVDRIAEVGCIVSSSPCFPVGFADKSGEAGLGPARADVMTRNRSVLERGVPLSFHSDLPMGAQRPDRHDVVRREPRHAVGACGTPERRIGVEQALRASRSTQLTRGARRPSSARSRSAGSPTSRSSTRTRSPSTRSASTRSR